MQGAHIKPTQNCKIVLDLLQSYITRFAPVLTSYALPSGHLIDTNLIPFLYNICRRHNTNRNERDWSSRVLSGSALFCVCFCQQSDSDGVALRNVIPETVYSAGWLVVYFFTMQYRRVHSFVIANCFLIAFSLVEVLSKRSCCHRNFKFIFI